MSPNCWDASKKHFLDLIESISCLKNDNNIKKVFFIDHHEVGVGFWCSFGGISERRFFGADLALFLAMLASLEGPTCHQIVGMRRKTLI